MSDRAILLRYLVGWVGMVFIAIFNGILRGVAFVPLVSELAAHQISCVTGVLLFFIVAMIYNRKWSIGTERQALLIGLMWVILTPIFEFIFGTFVMGQPLDYLINDYNLLAGRAWSLVLLAIFLIPTVVYKIRGRSE
jgi:hypothetical protein